MGVPMCTVKSTRINEFPDFKFNIGEKEYVLPTESYVTCSSATLSCWLTNDCRESCRLGLMSHETITSWILGLNFLQNYYTVYDQQNQ